MAELISSPEVWASFLSLTLLEIVLGVDNVIFISIAASRLPPEERRIARTAGLAAGMLLRIALLLSIVWIASLEEPIVSVFGFEFSGRDIIFVGGGAFLIWKSVRYICLEMDTAPERGPKKKEAAFWLVFTQIMLLDIVFSLDSVITAVGIARDHVPVMVAAIIIAVIVMMVASGPVSRFVERHPSTRMLCLAFLLLIGIALFADGFGHHIEREFIYGGIIFAGLVEALNLFRAKKARTRS